MYLTVASISKDIGFGGYFYIRSKTGSATSFRSITFACPDEPVYSCVFVLVRLFQDTQLVDGESHWRVMFGENLSAFFSFSRAIHCALPVAASEVLPEQDLQLLVGQARALPPWRRCFQVLVTGIA